MSHKLDLENNEQATEVLALRIDPTGKYPLTARTY